MEIAEEDTKTVYIIFNSDTNCDVQKIPLNDISLVDVMGISRNNHVFNAMLFITIACGVLVLCEIVFDIFWISEGVLEVLCAVSLVSITSSFWYFFIKRYEVIITYTNGKKLHLR